MKPYFLILEHIFFPLVPWLDFNASPRVVILLSRTVHLRIIASTSSELALVEKK